MNVLLGKVKAFLKGRKKKESESEGLVREWMDAGFSLLQEGDSLGAQKLFEKILNVQPNNSDALYLLGVILSNQGELTQSTTLLKKAITADSSIASYHLTLANVFAQTGNTDESLVCYLRAVELDPQDPESRTGLGNALLECKQFGDAKAHFAEALRMVPDAALAHYNIAVANQALNLTVEAIKYYRNAILKNPLLVQAENNIGVIYFSSRDYDCAIASFRRVSQLQPDFALGWENLGIALQANRSLDEACACLRRAIELNPDSFNAYSNLALALREQGKLHESQESSLRALSIKDSLGERIRISTLIPVIASSADSIEEWRRKFSEGLDRLMLRGGNVVDPLKEIGVCNFNLAYQPKCNRDLQIKSATLYSSLCPSLNYTAQHCQVSRARTDSRIKVGFISKFMFNHSIGRTTRGLVAKMSRERFHVVALFVPPMVDDSISSFIWQHSDQQISLPSDLQDARERIAALELDVLFYQDIGMDAYTYFLAYSRLATVQCVSFGHPDTTGIPNMDYWVSSEYFETAMAKDHYSEKLFLLKDVGTLAYYYRPTLGTSKKSRQNFGLSTEKNIYLCAQALFKLHPDFDDILAGILKEDPSAEVILIEAPTAAWGEQLRSRFAQKIPKFIDRIRFVPGMSPSDFLAQIAVSDVMLDTPYFNGMNTSLEALAMGTPVVTMPTDLQRGRHTMGMYQRMGMDACIANSPKQYIEVAVKLGTDKAYRELIRMEILSKCDVLYEDMTVVHEFERFFEEACLELEHRGV